MNGVAVVVPAYNEAATVRDVVAGALVHTDSVIVVDDGSSDGTAARLRGLPVTLLVNERNRGKAASIWRGAKHAFANGATSIITVDGDGQHDPADLGRLLLAAAAKPNAIIIGARLHAKDRIPALRYRANRFANFWIAWAAGTPIDDSQSGFRYYPAAVFSTLPLAHGREASFVFESEVLIAAARAGIEIASVPISVRYTDLSRASHFRPVADFARIGAMVARRLFCAGFNLPGLVRSLRLRSDRAAPPDTARYPRKP